MTVPKDQREAFERWHFEEFGSGNLARSGDGYLYGPVNYRWRAWQAALASAAERERKMAVALDDWAYQYPDMHLKKQYADALAEATRVLEGE